MLDGILECFVCACHDGTTTNKVKLELELDPLVTHIHNGRSEAFTGCDTQIRKNSGLLSSARRGGDMLPIQRHKGASPHTCSG